MIDGRLIICGWILLLTAGPLVAGPFDARGLGNQFAQPAYAEKHGISLDEAISRARRQADGKVLSAETVRDNGRRIHRIKILTRDGRVKRVRIDANTGRPAPRGR